MKRGRLCKVESPLLPLRIRLSAELSPRDNNYIKRSDIMSEKYRNGRPVHNEDNENTEDIKKD